LIYADSPSDLAFETTSAKVGFFGLSSFFGGFLPSPGFITGGGGFGGGFFWSSFCAETAIVMPVTNTNVNKIFFKTFMAFIFPLSLISRLTGKEGKCVRYFLGNPGAKDALMTL
jgi:hypothetical protein